ncbi:MAG: CMP-N-acetylneuraminic acid synthetase [Eubacterium sp.]|nr:CMP-N-acetylneuraminic acid synthetase [Eubacterium sp.]MCM1342929.1 acylneuraminate cytidylyltransferase [Muribaculaceae bacterium]MCM1411375.1 CMP-N-acetylneuraminic acid synthetase [Lachnospiraceae bacterium]
MKTVAFMPIKLNNERVPGKNTKRMQDGRPLISFMLDTMNELREEGVFDDAVVYCSNAAIKEYLPKGISFLKRPESLDTNSTKSNDIIRAFLADCDADIYAMCHATSPFMSGTHIKACIDAVRSGEYDSAFCASKIQNFLWTKEGPLNFSRDNYPRTQDLPPVYSELPTPYVFTKEVFSKTGGRTGYRPYICECSLIESIDIDNPEDFELANVIHMAGIDEQIRRV